MLNNLPTKTNIIYGVGIPATTDIYQDDNFYVKASTDLKTLYKLRNKFKLLNQSLATTKKLAQTRELTLENYAEVFLGIASKLITRNALTYTERRDKLNNFGQHIKKIRNIVDYSKTLEVGTISQFYSNSSNLFDTIEGTLKNYYNSLGIDYTLSPKAKHNLVINKLKLDTINWSDVYNQLLLTFNNENLTSIQKANLITTEDFIFLKVKFTLLLLSESEFNYYNYLELNNITDYKLISLFYNALKFDLIGSIPRFYLALLIESLITAFIYIKTLPDLVSNIPLNLFLENADYLDYKKELANYFRLASEVSYILGKFNIFKEMVDFNKFITKDYIRLTQYIYNIDINLDYSLIDYYAGI